MDLGGGERTSRLVGLPIKDHGPGVGGVRSGQDFHQCRFARAIFADQGQHLTWVDLEIDPAQSGGCTKRLGDAAPYAFILCAAVGLYYVADHITCSINIGRPDYQPVPVEMQVRTILDDAWARVSLTIDYKKNNAIVKRNERMLKKLRAMIDEIEEDLRG